MRLRFATGVCAALLVAATAASQSIAEARDTAARGKTLQLEASTALSQNDRDGWATKNQEALRLLREAAWTYRQAGVETSSDAGLLAEYAGVLEQSRDFDLAADVYAQLTEVEPDVAEWHVKQGVALLQVGPLHRKEAKASLERGLALGPDAPSAAAAAAALARLFWDLGRYDLAGQFAERAHRAQPDHFGAATVLAAVLVRRGDMSSADRILGSLRSFRGDEFARSQEKLVRALSDFEQYRGWFEDISENHMAYARVLARVGRHADAVLPLRRVEMLEPGNTTAINLLGTAYRQIGDVEQARAAFQRSLRISPDQPAVREALNAID